MTTQLTVGVSVGHHYTGWAIRRADELLAAGTWVHRAAVEVDARRAPVPPPSAEELAGLVRTIRAACGDDSPARVGVSRVVLPTPTSQRGTIAKRALHTLPACAAIAGAVVGAWADVVTEVDYPDGWVEPSSYPSALKTPSRKGKPATGAVTGGYRGGLREARAAWDLAGLADGIPGKHADLGCPATQVVPAGPVVTEPVKQVPSRIDPAAFRRAPADLDRVETPLTVQADPATEYSAALLDAIRVARPTTPAALEVAAADALALVPPVDGLTVPTPAQLASFATRSPDVLPAEYRAE